MSTGTVTIQLGKDVTITGVSNARSCTVSHSASEVDVTKFGDTSRKFRKALIEQTVEVECVDSPGVTVGGTFTINGVDFDYGLFITALITFLLTMAVIYFVVVVPYNKFRERIAKPVETAPAGPTNEEKLLMEIRDALRAR